MQKKCVNPCEVPYHFQVWKWPSSLVNIPQPMSINGCVHIQTFMQHSQLCGTSWKSSHFVGPFENVFFTQKWNKYKTILKEENVYNFTQENIILRPKYLFRCHGCKTKYLKSWFVIVQCMNLPASLPPPEK